MFVTSLIVVFLVMIVMFWGVFCDPLFWIIFNQPYSDVIVVEETTYSY